MVELYRSWRHTSTGAAGVYIRGHVLVISTSVGQCSRPGRVACVCVCKYVCVGAVDEAMLYCYAPFSGQMLTAQT